jgi:hypothetical protein
MDASLNVVLDRQMEQQRRSAKDVAALADFGAFH